MIIFSDLHAHTFKEFCDNRLELIKETLESILSYAQQTNQTVLFCGDLIHKHGYVPSEVLYMLLETFKKYSDVPIKAISGNHDVTTVNYIQTPAHSILKSFDFILPNFELIDYAYTEVEGYMVWGIPYMSSPSEFYHILKIFSEKTSGADILLMHQTPSKLMNEFIPVQVDIEDIHFDMFNYVFSGHIHRYQELVPNRYMVGNPLPQDRSDIGNEKGFLELLNGKVTRHTLKSPLDSLILNDASENIKKTETFKQEKVEQTNEKFFSNDIVDQMDAFADAVALDFETLKVGKILISHEYRS